MKVKCADCGEMYDHIHGDYGPADVCGLCFDKFDGMRAEDLERPKPTDLGIRGVQRRDHGDHVPWGNALPQKGVDHV